MNVRKFTTAKDDIGGSGRCSWNEHLFFEPKNVVWLFSKVFINFHRKKKRLNKQRLVLKS